MSTLVKDPQLEAITIRVVFDGAPFAGKTTAAYSLSHVLGGSATTPAEEEGRTVWFDWLTYSGGHHEGRDIRVELVTVPGQAGLASRRRHLLSWGDVVVFIADTSKSAFASSVAKHAELQSDLAIRGDLPVVVIANKRDLPDALPIEDVRSQLGLNDSELLIEVIATSGGGLREAFIHAVRAALASSANRQDETTADELLEQMQSQFSMLQSMDDEPVEELEALPVRNAPTTEALVEEAPVDEAPIDEAPVDEAHAEEAPIDEAPVDEAPVEEAHADEALVDEAPDAPAEELEALPVRNAPAAEEVAVVEDAPEVSASPEPEPQPQPTETAGPAVLHGVRMNPAGIAAGGAVVILADHWRVLVDIANGRTEFRVDDGSAEATAASDLATWGLIISDEPPASDVTDHRDVREIRRSLRG